MKTVTIDRSTVMWIENVAEFLDMVHFVHCTYIFECWIAYPKKCWAKRNVLYYNWQRKAKCRNLGYIIDSDSVWRQMKIEKESVHVWWIHNEYGLCAFVACGITNSIGNKRSETFSISQHFVCEYSMPKEKKKNIVNEISNCWLRAVTK